MKFLACLTLEKTFEIWLSFSLTFLLHFIFWTDFSNHHIFEQLFILSKKSLLYTSIQVFFFQ